MQQVNLSKKAYSLGRLSYSLETILASQGGYLTDSLYAFKRTKESEFELQLVQNKKSPKLRWLILSREHYFETSKEYPIANKQDLKQALRFDDDKAPFEGVTLQHIERINEQSHRVTFWVINPNVLDNLDYTPWLILPESYVLAKALNENINIATIECINKTLFISKTGRGIFSGVQSPQTPNLESFAFSTGSPISVNSEQYFMANAKDFVGLLRTGLKSLTLTKLQGFVINSNSINWQNYPWKQAGVITTIVFTVYLMLSSGWLVFKQQQLEQQLIAQKTQVNQALSLQKKYQQQLQWQAVLAEPLKDAFPYWKTWPILLEAVSVGAKFTAVHYKNSKIIIHGTANESIKATDVLAKLSKNTNVASPSFSKPVRKYRGKEDFAISFSFPEALLQQQLEQE
ncbi:MAG: hypothetical protein COB83_12260 [Gammaproteobacteria bacterium]|nr:MAG: hypothetical protein COB83_12260 [Gammaproteobacteria bacterium]